MWAYSSVSIWIQCSLWVCCTWGNVWICDQEHIECVCVCVCECEKVWGNACISMHFIEWMCLVQLFSCVWLFVTPWTAAHQASRSITNFWSLLKLMSIELVMPSNHLILCRPLLLLPSIFCSIRVISNESVLELVNRHMGSEGGSMDQGQSLGIVRCR